MKTPKIKAPLQKKRRQPSQPHRSGRGRRRRHAGRRRSQAVAAHRRRAGGRRRRTMRAQSLGCNPSRDCALSRNRARCFHCIEERLRGVVVLGLAPKQCCSGRGGYFSHYDARSGRVRDEARSFSFFKIPSEVAFCFFRASERANEGLVVGRCRCSVHSPWCCVGSARGPAARPPRLLVAWPEDGNGGWRTRRETGDGNGQCCCRGVAHHQEGHESADHRLTKRVCLARPLPVCLESVLKKRTGVACPAATTTHFRPARGGRGSQPGRQDKADVECLSSLLSCRAFFSSLSACLARRRDGMRQLRLLWPICGLFLSAWTVRASEP